MMQANSIAALPVQALAGNRNAGGCTADRSFIRADTADLSAQMAAAEFARPSVKETDAGWSKGNMRAVILLDRRLAGFMTSGFRNELRPLSPKDIPLRHMSL